MSIHFFFYQIWGGYISICQVLVSKQFWPYDHPIGRYAEISAKLEFWKKNQENEKTHGLAQMRCHWVKKNFFFHHI